MKTPNVVILGNGRSGTNWVMEVLNASPTTFCRNEPQEIEESPLQEILHDHVVDDRPRLRQSWQAFLEHTASHCGERDTASLVRKTYFHRWSYQLGLVDILRRPTVRRTIKRVYPSLPAEWRFPNWAGSRSRLEQAKLVAKINDLPAWLFREIFDFEETCFIHVIRHPAAQANSALRRHFDTLSDQERETEIRVYRRRLDALCRRFPEYRSLEPRFEESSLIELAIWFWKINNEAIWKVGQSAPVGAYLPIIYESLVAAPDDGVSRLYNHAGLALDRETIRIIQGRSDQSVWGRLPKSPEQVASAWRTQLPRELIQFIDRVILNESPLNVLWGQT